MTAAETDVWTAERNRWEGGWDVLGIVVSAAAYYVSEGAALPDVLGIRWFVDRHPCDERPWLAGIDFERAEEGHD